MATTINNYSVGLTLDAKDYIDGSKLSRAETRALIADINKARTPAEEFSRAQDRLKKAYDAGAISLETYNRLLEKHQSKLNDSIPVAEKKASSLERMSHMANIATASITAIRAGIDVVAGAKAAFDEVTNRIDNTAKSAQKLGLTFTQISNLNFAAGEAGVSLETLERGIKEMMKRGFAVDGDVEGSFLAIADEISGIADQSERMQRATEIFGKSGADMLVLLQSGRDAISESAAFSEKWLSLTEAQVIGVEQYNDTWARVGTIVEGLTNTFVAELAPVMTLIGEYIIDGANGFEDIDGTVRSVVDSVVYVYGVLEDVSEITNIWRTQLYNIATLNFEEVGKSFDEALKFDKGEKYLQAVYDKRFELEQKAAERNKQLADQRKKQQIEAIEEVAVIEEQKVENFDSLYKQAIANSTKEFERKAAEVKKMADSIARGPADIEAGSSAAAQYMANSVNRALADTLLSDVEQPGQQALAEEAAKQLEQLILANQKQSEQVSALQQLVEITSNNGFKRLR